jgi:signal transduction histidine kinase
MSPLPLVLVAPPGPARDRILGALPGDRPELFDSAAAFRGREGGDWGILILGPGIPSQDVLYLLTDQSDRETPWSALLVQEEGEAFILRPVSVGHPVSRGMVQEIRENPEDRGPLQELHWVLRVVAKARHDLNNPLTSGLAEAQLLLMDEHPEGVRESLEVIQDQFRRLRDMVADLSRLRVPKAGSRAGPIG